MLIEIDETLIARLNALYAHEPEECRPRTPEEAIAGALAGYAYLLRTLDEWLQHAMRRDVRERYTKALERARSHANVSDRSFHDAILDLGLAAAEDVL